MLYGRENHISKPIFLINAIEFGKKIKLTRPQILRIHIK